jgi:hypothetical protein
MRSLIMLDVLAFDTMKGKWSSQTDNGLQAGDSFYTVEGFQAAPSKCWWAKVEFCSESFCV